MKNARLNQRLCARQRPVHQISWFQSHPALAPLQLVKRRPLTLGTGLTVSDASSDLIDPMVRLLRLFDHTGDVPLLAPLIEREILRRLIHGDQGSLMRQIGSADSRVSQIARAIQWIRTHYEQNLRIEELAVIAGISAPTFFRHFRTVTAMSPIQYQKQIRLQEARARLITRPREVASVGFEVGCENPSLFSREYRRLFGVPPSRNAQRAQK